MEILELSRISVHDAVKKAAKKLRSGEIIIYPTDTVYGLGVDALNAEAVAYLRELKGRERKKPMLIIVPSVQTIEKYAELNDQARALAEKFLPGPLTLILRAKHTIPETLTLNGTIGIRVPNTEFCLALAHELGRPYITTSANRSGRETPSSVEEVLAQFSGDPEAIALAIDAGEMVNRVPSTIVTCVTEKPQVLREGAISRELLGI